MQEDRTSKVSRRRLLGLAAIGSAAAAQALSGDTLLDVRAGGSTNALSWDDGLTDAPDANEGEGWRYLQPGEVAFLTAASDRLIPADPTGPSASEAGVVVFLDRQLAGEYGNGAHFYLGGPWQGGTPSQGYQSRFTPAQFYRHAIDAIAREIARRENGRAFQDLSVDRQDELLRQIETGDLEIPGTIASSSFFAMLLQNVREGYFSDPIYGGNRDRSAWRMIGFPGAHYDYSEWVTAYDRPVPVEPVGLAGRPGWQRS